MRPKTALLTIVIAAALSTVVIGVGTQSERAGGDIVTASVDVR